MKTVLWKERVKDALETALGFVLLFVPALLIWLYGCAVFGACDF